MYHVCGNKKLLLLLLLIIVIAVIDDTFNPLGTGLILLFTGYVFASNIAERTR